MQVFIPYPSPIDVAKCLDPKRMKRQLYEYEILKKAARDYELYGGRLHPLTKMYSDNLDWLKYYTKCLESYVKGDGQAEFYSSLADACRPDWMTDELCDQHKRRLYTKDPEKYPQFAEYGKSEENWYVIDGQIVKYVNCKKVK